MFLKMAIICYLPFFFTNLEQSIFPLQILVASNPSHVWPNFTNVDRESYNAILEILAFKNEEDVTLNRMGAVQRSMRCIDEKTSPRSRANVWHTQVLTLELENADMNEDVGTLASVETVSSAYLSMSCRHRKRKHIFVLLGHWNSMTNKITRFSVLVLLCGSPEDRKTILFDPLPVAYVISGNIDLFRSFITKINDGFRYSDTRILNLVPLTHYAHKSTEESLADCMQ